MWVYKPSATETMMLVVRLTITIAQTIWTEIIGTASVLVPYYFILFIPHSVWISHHSGDLWKRLVYESVERHRAIQPGESHRRTAVLRESKRKVVAINELKKRVIFRFKCEG